MKVKSTLPPVVVLVGLFASALTPLPACAQLREVSRAAPSSCDDKDSKARLYKKFLDNYKGTVERQRVAYEAGKEYIARYGDCPDEGDKQVAAYVRKWLAKYEEAVREYERRKN